MPLRVGVLPHADLPHIIPSFRLCRELRKLGHPVRLLGSDIDTLLGYGHSSAWADQLGPYALQGLEVVHRTQRMAISDWLLHQIRELPLDMVILDAAWQGLAYACQESARPLNVVVHNAGLPDFRSGDMPSFRFVHPNHPKDHWLRARQSIEQRERAGRGLRVMFSTVKSTSATGMRVADVFDAGCSEFAALPAIRAMSLAPAVEFPAERGRIHYFGTLLPSPSDVDFNKQLPSELAEGTRPLIACVFGTTGLQSRDEYQWLASLARALARAQSACDVLAVIPDAFRPVLPAASEPGNLRLLPWVPLWELLFARRGPKLLIAPPGIGAFREAMASGTPIVAVPRRLDQFGAAARVEYFGVGSCLVSRDLPPVGAIVERVGQVLDDAGIRERTNRIQQELRSFDATQPLRRFMENPVLGASLAS